MIVDIRPLRGTPYWAVRFPYSPALLPIVKTIPGMFWHPGHGAWVGYKDAVARVRLLLEKEAPDVELTGQIPYALDWKDAEFPLPVAEVGLAEYQKEAVKFVLATADTGCILSLAMGAGKSAVALTAARALRARTLIVCLASARSVWTMADKEMGQVRRWWPDAYPTLVACEGTSPGKHDWHFYKREKMWRCRACFCSAGVLVEAGPDLHLSPDGCPALIPTSETQVVVIHYDIAHAWLPQLLAWGPQFLIIDEGHEIANQKSRRHQAVATLARAAPRKVILTGTPLTNRPKDLYGVVEVICPGRFGATIDRETHELRPKFFNYGIRYCEGHQITVPGKMMKTVWNFQGASHEKELAARMKHMMLYRTKEQLGLELPPMRTVVVEMEVANKYIVNPGLAFLKDKKAIRASLSAAADGKVGEAIQLSIDDASAGHKKVVFTFRRTIAELVANALNAKGVPADFIHGGLPQKRRDEILDKARAAPAPFILCATIDTTGTGIDLTFADICDFIELTYEPHQIMQARARLHRRRQKSSVLARFLVAKGTTDDIVKQILLRKIAIFEKVVGDTDDDLGESLDTGLKGQDALDELADLMRKRIAKEAT